MSESVRDFPVLFTAQPKKGLPSIVPPLSNSSFTADNFDLDMGKYDFPEKLQYRAQRYPYRRSQSKRSRKVAIGHCQVSRLKRDDYRIKVIDTVLSEGACPWLAIANKDATYRFIDVRKADFHTEIIKALLQDITPVQDISSEIEGALRAFSDVIIQSKRDIESRSSWVFLNIISWDPVAQSVRGAIRTVHYNITSKLINVVIGKSRISHVKMGLKFFQTEYALNENLWNKLKEDVKFFLRNNGNEKIRDPINGSIVI
ncbi:hypothetical protein ABW20_dc0104284 [Dactylellina cionopaga]|nr:hypothetical protein ABW20_dc0104284 [Dactylellina cionopaga]